ncbi:MAG: methyl-accepting chemotaxis protein, partial [Pseudomonadota bacterium]
MLSNLSIKIRLYIGIGLSLMAMLLLAGVDAYSVRQGSKSLQSVYENMVVPFSILKEMDNDLKDVRFRMLGYLLNQMPAVGNMNHVKEVKQKLPELWAEYKTRTRDNAFDDQAREQIDMIDSQLVALAPFLDKLEAAYRLEKKPNVTQLLEGDWLRFRAELLKPISGLLQWQQDAVKTAYEHQVAIGGRLLLLIAAVLASVTVVLVYFGIRSVNAISRPLDAALGLAVRIASGDLTGKVETHSNDEVGRLLKALGEMNDNLERLVSDISHSASVVATGSQELSAASEQL